MRIRGYAAKTAASALCALLALSPAAEAAQALYSPVRTAPGVAAPAGVGSLASSGLHPGNPIPALQGSFLSPSLPALNLPEAAVVPGPAIVPKAAGAVRSGEPPRAGKASAAKKVAALSAGITPLLDYSLSPDASPAASSTGIERAFASLHGVRLAPTPGSAIRRGASPSRSASRLSPAAARAAGPLEDDEPATQFTPGSVFDWKAVEKSPGHGFTPVDWLVRKFLGRKDERFTRGFKFTNVGKREEARVFLYGEKHTDKDVISENYAHLVRDIKPGQPARVLMEAYLGPTLFGTEAVRFLEKKGLDVRKMRAAGVRPEQFIVDGWDETFAYHEATRPELRYSMAMYGINQLLFSEQKGLAYYRQLYASAKEAYALWKVMRKAAIADRNIVLDRSVARAIRNMEMGGGTVHLIAGTEHLIEKPLTSGWPIIGRTDLRKGLAEVLGATPYWASRPDVREGPVSPEEPSDLLDSLAGSSPALKEALRSRYLKSATVREYTPGYRNLSSYHSIRRGLPILKKNLARTVPEKHGTLRVREVAGLAFVMFFAGMSPAAYAEAGDSSMVEALREEGYISRGIQGDWWPEAWQEISLQSFEKAGQDRGYSEAELRLGRALLSEFPALNAKTSVSDLVEYTGGRGTLEDFKKYYGENYAAQLRKRAGNAGIPPAIMYRLSLALYAGFSAITPYELRRMRWIDGAWRLNRDLDEVGLPDLVQAAADGLEFDAGPLPADETGELRPLFKDGKLDPEAIMLVHARHDLPDEEGRIHPNFRYGKEDPLKRSPRQLIEFSWNGVVDQWNGSDVIVLVPLNDARPSISNIWYNGTAALGSFKLPPGSVVMVREGHPVPDGLEKRLTQRGIRLVRFDKESPADAAARPVIEEAGFQAMTLGSDLFGGEGTGTTWMRAAADGPDHFGPSRVERTSALTRALAKQAGIPWAAGLSGHPLGRLTSKMGDFQERLERDGFLKPSYTELPAFKKDVEGFERDLAAVKDSPSLAGTPEMDIFLRYAELYSRLAGFELAFTKRHISEVRDARDTPRRGELVASLSALARDLSTSLTPPPVLDSEVLRR